MPPIADQADFQLECLELVVANPGHTLGELVSLSDHCQDDALAHEAARLALLPALHKAVARGYLVNGPARQCADRGVRTSTWLPSAKAGKLVAKEAEQAAEQAAGELPLQPVRGLRGLMERVHCAIAELRAEEAAAA